jgi:hypothetical protein
MTEWAMLFTAIAVLWVMLGVLLLIGSSLNRINRKLTLILRVIKEETDKGDDGPQDGTNPKHPFKLRVRH